MRSRIVVVAGRVIRLVVATVVMLAIGASGAEAVAATQSVAAIAATPHAAAVVPLGGGTGGAPDVNPGPSPVEGGASRAAVGLEDGIGGAVGIATVSLGLGGMALGVYRRRRGLVAQAEANRRR